jgi:ribonuclease HI
MVTFYTDGSGWNGKGSMWAVMSDSGFWMIKRFSQKYTNNEMEYEAMIQALELANNGDIICSDSQVVINQITGKYKVLARNLMPLFTKAWALYINKQVNLHWVPREENLAGIELEKQNRKKP